MIEESLEEFMSKVDIKNKNIAIYKNEEKGLTYPLNLTHLLCRVDYLELDEKEVEQAKFKQMIDDKEYTFETIEKIVDPYITILNSLPKVALGPLIIISVIWSSSNSSCRMSSFRKALNRSLPISPFSRNEI